MVHRSMRNGSRVADELYIKRVLTALEGFLSLLSILVLLYSKASYDFETASTLVLSCLVFDITLLSPISPTPDPARYNMHAVGLSVISFL